MVGHEQELPIGSEGIVDGLEEIHLDQAASVMADFWPWVWAKQVEAVDAGSGEQPFHEVFAFEAEDLGVVQVSTGDFFADFADSAKEAFDAKEGTLWELFGHVDEERAVAAAKVDFERLVGIGQIRALEALEEMAGDKFTWHGRSRQNMELVRVHSWREVWWIFEAHATQEAGRSKKIRAFVLDVLADWPLVSVRWMRMCVRAISKINYRRLWICTKFGKLLSL